MFLINQNVYNGTVLSGSWFLFVGKCQVPFGGKNWEPSFLPKQKVDILVVKVDLKDPKGYLNETKPMTNDLVVIYHSNRLYLGVNILSQLSCQSCYLRIYPHLRTSFKDPIQAPHGDNANSTPWYGEADILKCLYLARIWNRTATLEDSCFFLSFFFFFWLIWFINQGALSIILRRRPVASSLVSSVCTFPGTG